MSERVTQIIGFAAFAAAVVFLAFTAGLLTGVFKVFPFPQIEGAMLEATRALRSGGTAAPLHFMYAKRNDDVGVTAYDPQQVQPGVTLVTGMWFTDENWRPSIRLLDFDGSVLHEWPVRPEQIWPESPHDDLAKGTHNTPTGYIHGSALLPNGDVVFNIEYLGMVRMNACGEVVWKLPYRTHHSIDVDSDGAIWASGTVWREQPVEAYVGVRPPFVDETLVKVSPEGEIEREIFILQSLYDSGFQGTVRLSHKTLDLTHLNDVEVLTAELAPAFPMFNEGDVLVSVRNINLVAVVDGKTGLVKWHFSHPLIHQHDPDFEPDGRIVIFDNNDDMTRTGEHWGRSRILAVDPATRDFDIAYPTAPDQPFYSQEGGKHQLLSNGNRLITEANAGRVFEVTPAGEMVWNWVIDSADGDYLAEVLEGTRYSAEYAAPAVCAQQ